MTKKLPAHCGSIYRNTQAGMVYQTLKEHWRSSCDLAYDGDWISNITAVLSQVASQLPRHEVMVVCSLYEDENTIRCDAQIDGGGMKLWDEFHIFKSKKAARAWAKQTKPRSWWFWGEGR